VYGVTPPAPWGVGAGCATGPCPTGALATGRVVVVDDDVVEVDVDVGDVDVVRSVGILPAAAGVSVWLEIQKIQIDFPRRVE